MEIKRALIILIFFGLTGCATTDWNNFVYGNPKGSVPVYGFVCNNCHRTFTGTNDTGGKISEYINCPYCGIRLNTKLANNSYIYDQQQQSAAAFQQGLQNIQQIKIEKSQKQQQLYEDFANNLQKKRGDSPFRPIYVKPGY